MRCFTFRKGTRNKDELNRIGRDMFLKSTKGIINGIHRMGGGGGHNLM